MPTSYFSGSLVSSQRILYTPSTFAKTNLLHVQEVGTLQAQKPHTSKRKDLVSYLLFTVLSGSGALTYNGMEYELEKGDCVFIDCRKPYSHRSSENLWQLQWVHFYGPNMNSIFEKYMERMGQETFHPIDITPFLTVLAELYQLADSEEYVRDMMINEKLSSLLTLIMQESHYTDGILHLSQKKHNMQNIKEYLDNHYQEKISLDELASLFYINKFYLTRVFKEQYGLSIYSYLQQIKITHAKQLLRFTDDTLESISLACNMGDPTYFSRTFKKVEGISPGEFRKRWQEAN